MKSITLAICENPDKLRIEFKDNVNGESHFPMVKPPSNVGLINVAALVTDENEFDFENLAVLVRILTRNLDRSITHTKYYSTEESDLSVELRSIEIGICGLADLFSVMQIDYESNTALDLADKIAEYIQFTALKESI